MTPIASRHRQFFEFGSPHHHDRDQGCQDEAPLGHTLGNRPPHRTCPAQVRFSHSRDRTSGQRVQCVFSVTDNRGLEEIKSS